MYSRISKEFKKVVLPPRAEIAGLIPYTISYMDVRFGKKGIDSQAVDSSKRLSVDSPRVRRHSITT
jgi:hypothetical protein